MMGKLKVRNLSRTELSIINNFLIKNWNITLRNLLVEQLHSKNVYAYIYEGYFNEIYAINEDAKKIIDEILEKKKHPYALGFHVGRIRKNKFIPSLELGYAAVAKTNVYVIVNDKGEKNFLYGKDIFTESIIDIGTTIREKQIVLVLNDRHEYTGIGRALGAITKRRDKILAPRRKVIVKNIIDLGWYLRRGG